ncbi:MAG: amino acid adenylation domain-containing protein [Bryobacteraceae bacterium]
MGLFINTVPVRVEVDPARKAVEWLRDFQKLQSEMRDFEYTPLPRIQSWVAQRGEALFDSIFVFLPAENATGHGTPESVVVENARWFERTNYGISAGVAMSPRSALQIDFDAHRFAEHDIARMADCYLELLSSIIAAPGRAIGVSPPRSHEKSRSLDTSPASSLIQLFEEQVERTPNAIAVLDGSTRLTYRELDDMASGIAARLMKSHVQPDDVVGLLLPRSQWFLAAVLGIFKTGCAYLPFDPNHPPERIAQIVSDSRIAVVLSGPELVSIVPTHYRSGAWHPRQTSYVIYTSGSTGTPKGAVVELGGMMNHLFAKVEALDLTALDTAAQTASQCFDVSVWQFLAPLLVGGRVCIMPDELACDPRMLVQECEIHNVTILELVPAQLSALLDEPNLTAPTLRWLISTGEALPRDLANRAMDRFPHAQLMNAYGPTECSDDVTHAIVSRLAQLTGNASVPIGRPIRNTQLYVAGLEMEPVPPGVAGELLVGGAGVGRGYLRDAWRTAESFVPDPFSGQKGDRLYRTGDLVRQLRSGEFEFLGRIDQQVKIRGFRVELGEIEAALRQHPEVRDAGVIATKGPSGEQRLAACLVPRNGSLAVNEIKGFLGSKLPSYMVPGVFVGVQSLPLSSNGKLNRQALAAVVEHENGTTAPLRPPSTDVEEKLTRIWSDLLKAPVASVDSNFFELGGDSILSIQVVSRATREGLRFTVRQLFEHPTITELAALMPQGPVEEESAPLTQLAGLAAEKARLLFGGDDCVEDSYPLSPMQQGMFFYHQLESDVPAYNVEISLAFDEKIDVAAFQSAWQSVLSAHAIFRTSFVSDNCEEPLQVVHRDVRWPIRFDDWSAAPEPEQERLLDELLLAERRRKWDLTQVPLLRVVLIQCGPERFHLIWSYHHILLDGWSWPLVLKDVFNAYQALSQGRSAKVERPRPYRDFIAWLRQQDLAEAERFWRAEFASFKPLPSLAEESLRKGPPDYRIEWLRIDQAASGQLDEAAKRQQVTANTILQMAWGVWLAAKTGRNDIVFGVASSGRPAELAGVETMVGPFINAVPFRLQLAGTQSVAECLAQVQVRSSEARRFEHVPLARITSWAGLEPGEPLYETFLAFQNYPIDPAMITGDLRVQVRNPDTAIRTNNPLTLGAVPGTQMSLYLLYDSLRFRSDWIVRSLREVETILDTLVSDPKIGVEDLLQRVSAREEKQQMTKGREGFAARLKSISSVKPQVMNLSETGLVSTHVHDGGATRALVMEPKLDGVDLGSWIARERETIERRLLDYGAVLFRRFGPQTEATFGGLMRNLRPELLDYTEGSTPRSHLGDQIYTSTEYPPEQSIPMHNEMSYTRHWPMKIGFCCVKPAERGGETPIADSREVYRRLDQRVRERFAEKKVMYVRNYGEGLDVPWQRTFLTSDRGEVERYCAQGGIQCEWLGGDGLRTKQVSQAVFNHPVLNQPVWFNQAHLFHISNLEKSVLDSLLAILREEELPRNAYYGDGTRIESSALEEIRRVYSEVAMSFPWQAGDVLLLDNMLVAHGRHPFSGSRKVVVAMAESYLNTEL